MQRTDSDTASGRVLTVHQVADRLNVSPRTVWSWLAAGRLCGIKLGPRTTRIPEESLREFLVKCEADARS